MSTIVGIGAIKPKSNAKVEALKKEIAELTTAKNGALEEVEALKKEIAELKKNSKKVEK